MFTKEFLFDTSDVPFAECHASSLCRTADGGWYVVWFAGTHERHPDVRIWGSQRSPEGVWSTPKVVAAYGSEAHWNPVLHRDNSGRLHLWFKVGVNVPVWRTMVQTSENDGRSWSRPTELVVGDIGGRGPVKNPILVTRSGIWLAGASIETASDEATDAKWDVFVDRSTDHGKSWTSTKWIERNPSQFPDPGAIQPALWESGAGQIHMLCRTTSGWLGRSDSSDDGRTWSPLRRIPVPHNNSGVDVCTLPDGRVVLCCNPIPRGTWPDRSPISILVSKDNGETFTKVCDLETEPQSEFSYPTIETSGPNKVTAVYTWKRRRIVWADVTID